MDADNGIVARALVREFKNVRAVQGMDYSIAYKVVKQGAGIVTKNVGGLELPTVKDLGIENKHELKGLEEGKLVLGSTLDTPLVNCLAMPRVGKTSVSVLPATAATFAC